MSARLAAVDDEPHEQDDREDIRRIDDRDQADGHSPTDQQPERLRHRKIAAVERDQETLKGSQRPTLEKVRR